MPQPLSVRWSYTTSVLWPDCCRALAAGTRHCSVLLQKGSFCERSNQKSFQSHRSSSHTYGTAWKAMLTWRICSVPSRRSFNSFLVKSWNSFSAVLLRVTFTSILPMIYFLAGAATISSRFEKWLTRNCKKFCLAFKSGSVNQQNKRNHHSVVDVRETHSDRARKV